MTREHAGVFQITLDEKNIVEEGIAKSYYVAAGANILSRVCPLTNSRRYEGGSPTRARDFAINYTVRENLVSHVG